MAKRIRLTLDGVAAIARLHEDAAPQTTARFWAALPLEERLRHVRWSGDAGYFITAKLADSAQPIENPVTFYPRAASCFAASTGRSRFRTARRRRAITPISPTGRAISARSKTMPQHSWTRSEPRPARAVSPFELFARPNDEAHRDRAGRRRRRR